MKEKFTKEWFKAALSRTLWTMIETALTFITVGKTIADIDWLTMASMVIVAGLYTLLTLVARNLPEVPKIINEDCTDGSEDK